MLEQGVTIGLGPDWTPSGTDEMLSEMRYAYSYGQAAEISALHQERIWQMATKDGAEALGLGEYVGRLAPGMKADIAVFGRRAEDPYRALLDSRAQAVRLVMIGGAGYYADADLETATAINDDCELLDACG